MGLIISKIKKETGSPAAGIQLELCQAARAGDCATLARLIQAGADVNAYDPWDAFPLYHACVTGQREAARMLLDAGADYSESTSEGKRCYLSALNLGIRRLLREYEADPRAGLPATLLPVFLACNPAGDDSAPPTDAAGAELSPDITLYVEGRAIQAHRVILAARSPYFRRELATSWRNRKALRVTFDSYSPSFEATYGLVRYFYSDRLEVAMEHIEDLARVCETCECDELLETIDRLFPRKRRGEGARHLDRGCPQKRFVLQRRFAPDRLSSALRRILHDCLANSRKEDRRNKSPLKTRGISSEYDDTADVRIKVGDRVFRCHQMILALRSEYFRTRLSRRTDFRQHHYDVLEEHDVNAEAFEKMLEYIYTDELQDLGDDPLTQAEDLFNVASRYLLFQLKPVVAKLLLPHLVLNRVSPAQLCRWLTLSDMYDVVEVREHCLDIMACNFETFAEAREFRPLLLASRKSAPADNLVNNLQRRWLRIAAAGLSER
ncbi:BTB/POZ domain-containing protein At2g04740-like [Lolium perenne]|uniref:BTB/POZ domain-containing protein At2g04740-like n=1 Tax=Lolium perenne TaxID=4522 RepID=UPI0021F55529|nr:BTB/POZ domain-containing protein At2g04740-like [Lolium perenne]